MPVFDRGAGDEVTPAHSVRDQRGKSDLLEVDKPRIGHLDREHRRCDRRQDVVDGQLASPAVQVPCQDEAELRADYPDYFLEQIREQGLFDGLGKTRSSIKVDEQSRIVDVTLNFGASTESDGASPATSRRRRR